jgi:hypothetical protein
VADEFIARLPEGYDERTRLALRDDNQVIATHPGLPPLVLGSDGQWVEFLRESVHPAHSPSTC